MHKMFILAWSCCFLIVVTGETDRHVPVPVKGDTFAIFGRDVSGPLPNELDVSFPLKDDVVNMRLKRNYEVKHDVPVTFVDGTTIDERAAKIENTGLYQDVDKRAAISVTSKRIGDRYVRSLEGSFIHNDKFYVIRLAKGTLGKRSLSDAADHIVSEQEIYLWRKSIDVNKRRTSRKHKKNRLRKPSSKKQKSTKNPKPFQAKASVFKTMIKRRTRRKHRKHKSRKTSSKKHKSTKKLKPFPVKASVFKTVVKRRDPPMPPVLTIPLLSSHKKPRSASPSAYTVELLLLLDHTIWERNMELASNNEAEALKKIKYYFAHLVNGMDLAYSSINAEANGYTIDVVLKGYEIAKTKAESVLTVPFLMAQSAAGTPYSQQGLNSEKVLNYMSQTWRLTNERAWFNVDHAMVYTRYNLMNDTTAGMAIVNGICSPNANSVVEDRGFHSWFTAAHELGHSLGSRHDEDRNTCSRYLRNIMTPAAGRVESENVKNIYLFSSCSINAMKSVIEGVAHRRYPRGCLKNKPCPSPVDISKEIAILPGVKYNADEQCKIRFGLESSQCTQYNAGEAICLTMFCKDVSGKCKWSQPGAADGTPCGTNKWCYRAKCVPKTSPEVSAEACIAKNLAITPPSGCSTHPQARIELRNRDGTKTKHDCENTILREPWYCFLYDYVKKYCCATCHKYGLVKG